MNDFFQRQSPKPPPHSQPLNPNQGLRMLHAPPLLPNARGKKVPPPPILSDAPLKLHIPNRSHKSRDQLSNEELTVNNLRKLYSSVIEEMAPLHHENGTNANYRWKNSGTVTVDGSDGLGYDYSFTPDNSKKSWRLQRSGPGGTGGGSGITGGDWAVDGIQRYYTGGTIEHGGDGGNKKKSSNVISVGGMTVDVGMMDGVEISPNKKHNSGGNDETDHHNNFSIDDEEDEQNATTNEGGVQDDVQEDLDIAPSACSLEDVALEPTLDDDNAPPSSTKSNNDDVASNEDNGILFGSSNNMTTFESMYHLSPSMAWRLRSAYSPTTRQESHLLSLGSEILAQRHPEKADGIMRGLEVARNSEARVCDGLQKIGELISYCERLKGAKFVVKEGRKFGHGSENATVSTSLEEEDLSSEEDEEELEAAEAVFSYFCEKNVLPMLIDSLLCHPPPLTSMEVDTTDNMVLPSNTTTIGSSPSPFSGVTWTAAVKAQILQTMSMVLFNTSSPLSLTYLLSNNYMNELIMGILPLDKWKEDSLEEILPPYITLLRGLVLRLRGDEGKSCLPLFLCQRQRHGRTTQADKRNDNTEETYLPLLYAAVQVFCSSQSSLRDSEGCLVRTTAMNVILNLCRITDTEVRSVLVQGRDAANGLALPSTKSAPPAAPSPSLLSHPLTVEQELLFPHICRSLINWYHRSVRLAMASLSMNKNGKPNIDEAKAEARSRHKDLALGLFSELQYWLGFLDDLLSCDIRAWNARFVEWFLREVVVGTVLLRWNESVEVIERCGTGNTKVSSELYKARAETRISVVFFTQLFSMIEYSPLVRLVGTLLLHHKYPRQWCGSDNSDFSKDNGFFVVTPAINAMISKQSDINADSIAARTKEEADAGAGGRHRSAGSGESSESRGSEISEDVELNCNEPSIDLVPNLHRATLLKMLAGAGYSTEETVLASMLLATVLENDAVDDNALEIFGVLGEGDSQLSPFEASIAQCLTKDCWTNEIDSSLICQTLATLECVSTLGLMLIERIIFHTWTEGGQCLDAVPFVHSYNSSKFVQALGTMLNKLASQAQLHVPEVEINTLKEIGSDLIRKRYSTMDIESPHSQDEPVRMTCSLQSLYPSNFIDNACVLTELSSQRKSDTSAGDLHLVNIGDESTKFATKMTLHLRSILGCIQDLKDRVTLSKSQDATSRWHGEDGDDNLLSLRTTEEADDILLSIGGIQTTLLPEVGSDIDLRGRTVFKCSLPRKSIFGRKVQDIVIDADGVKIVVTERANLVLVVDPSEIYVAQTKKDANRCLVLAMIPLKTIIASATEAETLHVVCNTKEIGQQIDMLRNGTLSVRFPSGENCTSAKEFLDKYCASNEKKILMDMSDWLEQCTLMGANHMNSTETEDSFCDFQSDKT